MGVSVGRKGIPSKRVHLAFESIILCVLQYENEHRPNPTMSVLIALYGEAMGSHCMRQVRSFSVILPMDEMPTVPMSITMAETMA